jgi:pimeloyl-ACP methyl ester carboxylesterase
VTTASDPTIQLPPAALECLRQARRHDIEAGGARTVWREWGPGPGRPLVLLHGGSGSWTHWLRNIPSLAADGHRVLVPDLPGFGKSEAPAGAQDADGIWPAVGEGIARLVGEGDFNLVAFSFGSLVAGYLATQRPPRIRRLVLVAPPALGVQVPELGLRSVRGVEDAAERDRIQADNLGRLMLHRPASIDAEAVALQQANVAQDRMRRRGLARTDLLLRQLPRIDCELWAICGAEDALYRGSLGEIRARLGSAPRFQELFVIPGAGHWVQYEEPQAFAAVLRTCLAERPA